MTEEEVKGLLKEASEKIKDDFIPSMTNILMDVFQHGINKGTEIGVKIGADKRTFSIKWQTGEPVKEGYYLVTDNLGYVRPDYWGIRHNEGGQYHCWSFYTGNQQVLAWYPVSGFEPYKPKDDGIIPF